MAVREGSTQNSRPPLGAVLLKRGLITEEALERALEIQRNGSGRKLGEILVEMGVVSEEDVLGAMAEAFGLPLVRFGPPDVASEIAERLPLDTLKNLKMIPLRGVDGEILVGVVDPLLLYDAITTIKVLAQGRRLIPCLIREQDLLSILSGGDVPEAHTQPELLVEAGVEEFTGEDLDVRADTPVVIRLVNGIITAALERGASDIHIEPQEREIAVRLRIDGILRLERTVPLALKNALIQRVKIMARMDIAERRVPQDGRIRVTARVRTGRKSVDIRVSTVPTVFGEKIVMRILDREKLFLDLSGLGFEPESLKLFEEAISKPWGLILVTGPTGSGKTNTLYSAVQKLNRPEVNIMTVEDPVEFVIHGINQVQVNEVQGLTFAAALRAFLRQDPNIILVGEIRDAETLDIAVKASLTGHLVLSTLHTNDAPSTIARLINMGVERHLIGSSLLLVVAQRLVRKVCQNCAAPDPVGRSVLLALGFSPDEVDRVTPLKGKGCHACGGTGYRGRTGLFEVLRVSPEIRELVFNGATTDEIRQLAISQGMVTLRRSGLIKIMKGITSVEEVLRETL